MFGLQRSKPIILAMLILLIFSFISPMNTVYADGTKSNVNHGGIFELEVNESTGGIEIKGDGFEEGKQTGWQGIIEKYKYFIGGFGALALVTVVGALIIQFTKLSAAGDNPMKRKEILTGIGWTFVATVLLGATATIVAIAYRFL